MALLSRRTFVQWTGALAALLGAVPKRLSAAAAGDEQAPRALDEQQLVALAEAVLPAEIGAAGALKAARDFNRWIAGYRAGAEVLHPYGSDEITVMPASPLPTWRRQLNALSTAAVTQQSRRWTALGVTERRAIVTSAMKGVKIPVSTAPLSAPHVVLALLAHYFESPDATDVCYSAQIRKNQCRSLITTSREPLPVVRRGAT